MQNYKELMIEISQINRRKPKVNNFVLVGPINSTLACLCYLSNFLNVPEKITLSLQTFSRKNGNRSLNNSLSFFKILLLKGFFIFKAELSLRLKETLEEEFFFI